MRRDLQDAPPACVPIPGSSLPAGPASTDATSSPANVSAPPGRQRSNIHELFEPADGTRIGSTFQRPIRNDNSSPNTRHPRSNWHWSLAHWHEALWHLELLQEAEVVRQSTDVLDPVRSMVMRSGPIPNAIRERRGVVAPFRRRGVDHPQPDLSQPLCLQMAQPDRADHALSPSGAGLGEGK